MFAHCYIHHRGHILYNLLQQQSIIFPVICAFWINTPVSPARVLVSVLCLLLNLIIQPLKIVDLSISKWVVIGIVFFLMLVPSLQILFACAFCNHAAEAPTNSSSNEGFSAFCCSVAWCSVTSFSFLSFSQFCLILTLKTCFNMYISFC